jgi:hypothetical protein
VTDGKGQPIHGEIIKVKSLSNPASELRYAYSYENDEVNSDTVWGENFTLGDLPEGDYNVFMSDKNGKVQFERTVSVTSGHLSWVEIELE